MDGDTQVYFRERRRLTPAILAGGALLAVLLWSAADSSASGSAALALAGTCGVFAIRPDSTEVTSEAVVVRSPWARTARIPLTEIEEVVFVPRRSFHTEVLDPRLPAVGRGPAFGSVAITRRGGTQLNIESRTPRRLLRSIEDARAGTGPGGGRLPPR